MEAVLLLYFAIALIVCVATWIDNSATHYVMGEPPSGILTGLTWPIIAVVLVLVALVRAISKDPS